MLPILDELTAGLHSAGVERPLEVLRRLVGLGPEGGGEGGRVVATGTPEESAALADGSHTGRFPRRVLGQAGRGSRRPGPKGAWSDRVIEPPSGRSAGSTWRWARVTSDRSPSG